MKQKPVVLFLTHLNRKPETGFTASLVCYCLSSTCSPVVWGLITVKAISMPCVMIHHVAGILTADRGIPYTTSSLVPGVCESPGRQFIRLVLLLERPSGLLGKFW